MDDLFNNTAVEDVGEISAWNITRSEESIQSLAKSLNLECFKDQNKQHTRLSVGGKIVLLDIDYEEDKIEKVTLCYADSSGQPIQVSERADHLLRQSLTAGPDTLSKFASHLQYLALLDSLSEAPEINAFDTMQHTQIAILQMSKTHAGWGSVDLYETQLGLQFTIMTERELAGLRENAWSAVLTIEEAHGQVVPKDPLQPTLEDGALPNARLSLILRPSLILTVECCMAIETITGQEMTAVDCGPYESAVIGGFEANRTVYCENAPEKMFHSTLFPSSSMAKAVQRIPLSSVSVIPSIFATIRQNLLFETILKSPFPTSSAVHSNGIQADSSDEESTEIDVDAFLSSEHKTHEMTVTSDTMQFIIGTIATHASFSIQVLLDGKVLVKELLIGGNKNDALAAKLQTVLQIGEDLCISAVALIQSAGDSSKMNAFDTEMDGAR